MVATLDYAGFPHIFDNILRYCDQPTQNQLRLLSSSTKLAVDRYHCRYLQICEVADSPPHLLCIGTLLEPATLNSYRPMKVPLLSSPDGPLREGPNVLWAFRNTRHLTIWDRTLTSPGLNNLLTHLSDNCTDLTLHYSLIRLNNLGRLTDERKGRLAIPAHVCHLRVLVTTNDTPYWTSKHVDEVVHACATITIVLAEDSNLLDGLWWVPGVMSPCVEKLNLVLNRVSEPTAYLMWIEEGQLHPDLHVTICLTAPVGPGGLQAFREMWIEVINAKVTVEQWGAGGGGASVDSHPPTKSPGTTTPSERFLHTALGSL